MRDGAVKVANNDTNELFRVVAVHIMARFVNNMHLRLPTFFKLVVVKELECTFRTHPVVPTEDKGDCYWEVLRSQPIFCPKRVVRK